MTQEPYDPSLTIVKAPSAIHGEKRILMILSKNLKAPRHKYITKNIQIAPMSHLKARYILDMICMAI